MCDGVYIAMGVMSGRFGMVVRSCLPGDGVRWFGVSGAGSFESKDSGDRTVGVSYELSDGSNGGLASNYSLADQDVASTIMAVAVNVSIEPPSVATFLSPVSATPAAVPASFVSVNGAVGAVGATGTPGANLGGAVSRAAASGAGTAGAPATNTSPGWTGSVTGAASEDRGEEEDVSVSDDESGRPAGGDASSGTVDGG